MLSRRLLTLPLLALCAVHGFLMVRWVGAWGFFGALYHWFETFSDPISAAAGVDLMAMMVFVGIWMIRREGRVTKALAITLIPYIIFPSIGLLLYLMISERSLAGDIR